MSCGVGGPEPPPTERMGALKKLCAYQDWDADETFIEIEPKRYRGEIYNGEYLVLTEGERELYIVEYLIDSFDDSQYDLLGILEEYKVEDYFDRRAWASTIARDTVLNGECGSLLSSVDGQEWDVEFNGIHYKIYQLQ